MLICYKKVSSNVVQIWTAETNPKWFKHQNQRQSNNFWTKCGSHCKKRLRSRLKFNQVDHLCKIHGWTTSFLDHDNVKTSSNIRASNRGEEGSLRMLTWISWFDCYLNIVPWQNANIWAQRCQSLKTLFHGVVLTNFGWLMAPFSYLDIAPLVWRTIEEDPDRSIEARTSVAMWPNDSQECFSAQFPHPRFCPAWWSPMGPGEKDDLTWDLM